jgi:hypothetical protein
MVIATTGGGFEAGDIDNLALESIEAYNKNENYSSDLQQQIKAVQLPDTVSSNMFGDKFTLNEFNKNFRLPENNMNIKYIRFEQRNKDEYIILNFTDGSKEKHQIGINNQYKISNEQTFGLPMAVKGRWITDKTLVIDYNRLCRIEDYKFRITFKGNSIELIITEPTKDINETLIGKSFEG